MVEDNSSIGMALLKTGKKVLPAMRDAAPSFASWSLRKSFWKCTRNFQVEINWEYLVVVWGRDCFQRFLFIASLGLDFVFTTAVMNVCKNSQSVTSVHFDLCRADVRLRIFYRTISEYLLINTVVILEKLFTPNNFVHRIVLFWILQTTRSISLVSGYVFLLERKRHYVPSPFALVKWSKVGQRKVDKMRTS